MDGTDRQIPSALKAISLESDQIGFALASEPKICDDEVGLGDGADDLGANGPISWSCPRCASQRSMTSTANDSQHSLRCHL